MIYGHIYHIFFFSIFFRGYIGPIEAYMGPYEVSMAHAVLDTMIWNMVYILF